MLPFKVNYKQNSRMEFKRKKKKKYERAKKFIEKIKEIQKETKVL